MKKLRELLLREGALRTRLERSIQRGLQTPADKRTRGFYEIKLEELQKAWAEYTPVDQAIHELLQQHPNLSNHSYATDDNYGNLEEQYCQYVGEILDALRSASDIVHSTQIYNPQPQTETESNVLPKIALAKFNGDYDSWRSFYDLFVALVHNSTKLKPVQKLYYLKSALIGEAEKLLRHTPITNEDYLPALEKLKNRYENKRILTNHQLKSLFSQPKLSTETAKGLKSLIDTTEECLQQLKALQVNTSAWDLLLIHILVQKLPFVTLKKWEEYQGATPELPEYQQFKTFLNTRLKILEAISDTISSKPSQVKINSKANTATKAYYATKTMKCVSCNDSHTLQKCPKFQKMDIKSKRKLISVTGCCYNCLAKGHSVKECSSKFRCLKCQKRHHTILHEDEALEVSKQSTDPEVKQPAKEGPKVEYLHHSQTYLSREQSHQALLSTALIVAQGRKGKFEILRCLIDSGSDSSFITKRAWQKLSTECRPTSVTITSLNSQTTGTSTMETTIKFKSRQRFNVSIEEDFLVIEQITNHLPTREISRENCPHLKNLNLADPDYWKPGPIDALLGARVYSQIIRKGLVQGEQGTPTAVNTTLGWILLGSVQHRQPQNIQMFMAMSDSDAIDAQLKRFWEVEEIPRAKLLTEDDQQCQDLYKKTCKRLKSGKYEVKLPFINDEPPVLGESRSQALKRFQSLEKKLQNNPELKREYESCLNEYIDLDHMKEIGIPRPGEPHYYIPHHAVFKESTTTKLRVVFDASAKSSNGKSLNEFMLKGPTLQPTLFTILLNWRKHKVALSADIEKMYRMIEMNPEHRTYQRIVWRHPETKLIQDYQLQTVTFGTTSAPYLAIRTLQQLAEDEQANWPLASKVLCNSFYVDDLLTGADTPEDARIVRNQLIEIMNSAGFNLRKWCSNDVQLLNDLPQELVEHKDTLVISESESIKTL